ncbi:MAG TPA: hypothetical protein VK186_07475 [Candidatus Deferrimicrobium sp.]|nr:hypothetical protein [Candidatus Kapabacteria bacterium]HLP58650.1 hypothetical protein [Candidatus Deferrimicrobium sp.]
MIPVQSQPEPIDFDKKVRQKGKTFLAKKNVTTDAIRAHCGWRESLNDLYEKYGKICAYSACLCQSPTVDHFIPISALVKNGNPQLAYEWTNFRLASSAMNQHKHDFLDVLDPFTVQPGWFVIDFTTINLRILSGNNLPPSIKKKVDETILRLKLNDRYIFIQYRVQMVDTYCVGCRSFTGSIESNFNFLKSVAPFIAAELDRQNLKEEIVNRWIYLNQLGGK